VLFGGLFIAYSYMRYRYPAEFHHGGGELNVTLGVTNTLVLLTSSLTVVLAIVAVQRAEKTRALAFLGTTLGLGLTFLVIKSFEWAAKFHHGLYPSSPHLATLPPGEQVFFGLYFTMTGLHGLHVIAGIGVPIAQDGQPFPCTVSPIVPGQTIVGALTPTDCASVARGDRYADRYTFAANAGQQVAIELVDANFDAYLYLYGPGNQLLAQNDDILQTNCHTVGLTRTCDVEISDSRIPGIGYLTLTKSGTYTIEATSYYSEDVGAYTLRLMAPDSTGCNYQISPLLRNFPATGGSGTVNISVGNGCGWDYDYGASWIFASAVGFSGPGAVNYTVDPSTSTGTRSAVLVVANQRFTITQDGTACAFSLSASSATVPLSGATGSINLTTTAGCTWSVVNPSDWITFLSGGSGTGSATLAYTVAPSLTGVTRVGSMLIGGQTFTVLQSAALRFIPTTPCRIADTRGAAGPFGGPTMTADQSRDFAILSSGCTIPSVPGAYSLNVTVVPAGYLGFLTTWPAGEARPQVSTLNSWTGKVVANAALVPAGNNKDVSVYVSNPTDVILDINGYFGRFGSAGALSFYPVAPCRVVDTRGGNGPLGGPILEAQTSRSFSIPSGGCGIPASAAAYSMNVTVVPDGILPFLTAWPSGSPQPPVSTLNSFDGTVTANAALVPAGENGAISIYVAGRTQVILDIDGYFAP